MGMEYMIQGLRWGDCEKNSLWGAGLSLGICFWTSSVTRVLDTQAEKLADRTLMFRGAVQSGIMGSSLSQYLKPLSLMKLANKWVCEKKASTIEYCNMPVNLGAKPQTQPVIPEKRRKPRACGIMGKYFNVQKLTQYDKCCC